MYELILFVLFVQIMHAKKEGRPQWRLWLWFGLLAAPFVICWLPGLAVSALVDFVQRMVGKRSPGGMSPGGAAIHVNQNSITQGKE